MYEVCIYVYIGYSTCNDSARTVYMSGCFYSDKNDEGHYLYLFTYLGLFF